MFVDSVTDSRRIGNVVLFHKVAHHRLHTMDLRCNLHVPDVNKATEVTLPVYNQHTRIEVRDNRFCSVEDGDRRNA